MDTAAYIESIERDGQLLAEAAERAGLDAPVPTCPEWRVRDLLRHLGQVHRWAARYVAEGLTEPVQPSTGSEPDGVELIEWFRDGHRRLLATLTAAPADLECWTFLPAPSPLVFWARRQAHEIAIHRVDVQAALGAASPPSPPSPPFSPFSPFPAFPADFAADGIDEIVVGFHGLKTSKARTSTRRTLRIRATDTEDVWTICLSEEAPRTIRTQHLPEGATAADCELSGGAGDLYLLLWNRLPLDKVSVAGDSSLADLWREKSTIGRR
ncbi:maleylpyruvate isomerase family mycothiol-dependent enzyme [Streptomyces sp. NPDC057654]|uniref:maleylpyruvate isomerase family mycothiol-dependent enzyme n=1 Tax=Streptomyces sp. NPDC057654 TaxID=3346196 RepID=UPI0036AC3603